MPFTSDRALRLAQAARAFIDFSDKICRALREGKPDVAAGIALTEHPHYYLSDIVAVEEAHQLKFSKKNKYERERQRRRRRRSGMEERVPLSFASMTQKPTLPEADIAAFLDKTPEEEAALEAELMENPLYRESMEKKKKWLLEQQAKGIPVPVIAPEPEKEFIITESGLRIPKYSGGKPPPPLDFGPAPASEMPLPGGPRDE